MNGIAGEYLIIVNRMNIAEVGHLVIETQKRSFNDRSGSVSNEIAIGWFHEFNNLECFSARGSPQCVNVFGSMSLR